MLIASLILLQVWHQPIMLLALGQATRAKLVMKAEEEEACPYYFCVKKDFSVLPPPKPPKTPQKVCIKAKLTL